MDYINQNVSYWKQAVYDAPNPETFVFRSWSRVLKHDFNLTGENHETLLDFGCGPGGNTKYFHEKSFVVHGVDLSSIDIQRCKDRMPDAADRFKVISPEANRNDRWFGDIKFQLVTAFQSLYYYDDDDLEARLMSIYDMMAPGGVIFATMVASSCWWYNMSEPFKNGLRFVKFRRKTDEGRSGLTINDHYINFVENSESLRNKFHMFKPCHSEGYYDGVYRDDQGSEKHLVFIGQKEA